MSTGDNDDMLARIRATMPEGWFPSEAPALDAVLSGPAVALCKNQAFIEGVYRQTRLATADGVSLDLMALDYLGGRIARTDGESDDHFRERIKRERVRPRNTVAALESALLDLTGYTPDVFEPALLPDTGHTGPHTDPGTAFYETAGRWGSRLLPYQLLVTAYRPADAARATDDDIYAAVLSVIPAAVVAWTRITDAPVLAGDTLDLDFVLDESALD